MISQVHRHIHNTLHKNLSFVTLVHKVPLTPNQSQHIRAQLNVFQSDAGLLSRSAIAGCYAMTEMYECTAKWSLLSRHKMFSQLHARRKPGGRQRQKWKTVITQQHRNISYNRTGWGKLKVGCERSLGISTHGGGGGLELNRPRKD